MSGGLGLSRELLILLRTAGHIRDNTIVQITEIKRHGSERSDR